MNTKKRLATAVLAAASIFMLTVASGAGPRKLAAPVYPGAVAAVPADGLQVDPFYVGVFGDIRTLDCTGRRSSYDIAGKTISAAEAEQHGDFPGPWCFLSRDPVDKVKAFYDKSVGRMRPIQGENGVHGFQVYAERAWFPGEGEESAPGFGYTGVSLHALPRPPEKGKTEAAPVMQDAGWEGQQDYAFYAQTRHFGLFIDGVDWFGDPSKRKPSELDAVYKKYGYLESAWFQLKGPDLQPVDRSLFQHFDQLRGERQQAASAGTMSAYMQQGAASAQAGAGPTSAEDAEFNAIMQRNPELAKRYVALTQQSMTLMQQGKFDEADAVMDEIDALEQSNPELAALANRQQARAEGAQKAGKAKEDAIRASGDDQMDKAVWGTAMEYIEAADKEDYYTLIVIDNAFTGTEKDYSRDRALIDRETANLMHVQDLGPWDVRYEQPTTGSGTAAADDQPAPEEHKESLEDKAKNALKKWKPF